VVHMGNNRNVPNVVPSDHLIYPQNTPAIAVGAKILKQQMRLIHAYDISVP